MILQSVFWYVREALEVRATTVPPVMAASHDAAVELLYAFRTLVVPPADVGHALHRRLGLRQ